MERGGGALAGQPPGGAVRLPRSRRVRMRRTTHTTSPAHAGGAGGDRRRA